MDPGGGALGAMTSERFDERFELEARIGSGAMGEVFRARDPATGEVVAIKILPGSQGPLAERFTREIEMLAELDHPGIVRYISHGVTLAGEPFLVMEWLDGEVLRARLERGALPVADAIALATRDASAIASATGSAPRWRRAPRTSPSSHSITRNGSPASVTPCEM